MYGIIGQFRATPGNRDELASILVETTSSLPGCLSYIVAADAEDADALWVTEVWEDEARHRASLSMAVVQAAIARGRPLIADLGTRHVTRPVGGHGLVANPASASGD